MSEHGHPTARELRDLADLDALGLLEEIDQRRFERAFGDATIAEQNVIRERQATLVERLVGEPTEELPTELKERVFAAIRGEIENLDEALAPLARIGRRLRERAQREEERGIDALPIANLELDRIRRSAILWRAASFALTASLIAAIFFLFDTSGSAEKAHMLASQQAASEELLESYGHDLDALVQEDNADHVLGLATTSTFRGAASVVLNTSTNSAKLVTLGLKPGTYTINYLDTKNVVQTLGFTVAFPSTIVDLAQAGALPPGFAKLLASTTWEIKDSDNITVAVCNPIRLS